MELGFMELMRPAAVIVDDCLKVKPGEKVVVVADSRNHEYQGQESMIEALMAVMAERGIDPVMILYEGRHLSSPNIPELAVQTMEMADVVIAENSVLILQSQAMKRIWASETTRCILLPSGINITWSPDELYRMMPKTSSELFESSELMNRIGDKLHGNPKVHVTAANGTDFMYDLIPDPHYAGGISIDDGLCDKPGMSATIPTGNLVCICPEGSVTGKLVLDSEISLYNTLLPDSATLTFNDGRLVSIEGSGVTAGLIRDFISELDESDTSNELPEYGMGFNPKAQLNGNSSEGESILGCVHVGVGFIDQDHFDAIIPDATVEINGELVLKDGVFQ